MSITFFIGDMTSRYGSAFSAAVSRSSPEQLVTFLDIWSFLKHPILALIAPMRSGRILAAIAGAFDEKEDRSLRGEKVYFLFIGMLFDWYDPGVLLNTPGRGG
ncbi:MAG: hypothetical protein AAGA66_01305 [Bacteroidota bacterium]